MKIKLAISVICILFTCTSCLKKYQCKCTTTLTQEGYYPNKTETIEDLPKHSSKKKAAQICTNTQKQMQGNTREIWPEYIEVSTQCFLKDY